MGRYILKRLLMMIPVFIGVSFIVYCICGSNTRPILMKVGGDDMTLEEAQAALGVKIVPIPVSGYALFEAVCYEENNR